MHARQETMYLSFEAPSDEGIDAKVSKTHEGPILYSMEPAAISMPDKNQPREEIALTNEEGAQPASVDANPIQSSSLLDE